MTNKGSDVLERLADLILRDELVPHPILTRGELYRSEDPDGVSRSEDPSDVLDALAMPTWDEARKCLESGRYSDFSVLRAAISDEATRLRRLMEEARERVSVFSAMALSFESEIKQLDPTTTILDFVNGEQGRRDESDRGLTKAVSNVWGWKDVSDPFTIGSYEHEFSYEPGPDLADGFEIEGYRSYAEDLTFSGDTTLEGALSRSLVLVREANAEMKDTYLIGQAVALREEVVDQALRAFTVLGSIPPWPDLHYVSRYARLAADPLIVELCKSILGSYDDQGATISSRNGLYGAVGADLEMTITKVKDALRRQGVSIHRTKSKPGRYTGPEEKEELEYVLSEAANVVEAAGG